MRRVLIDDPVAPGETLARPVLAPSGEVLAGTGLRLTERSVRSLQGCGVAACFIDDAASAGVTIRPVIDATGGHSSLVGSIEAVAGLLDRPLWQARQQPTGQAIETALQLRPMAPALRSDAMRSLRDAVDALASSVAGGAPAWGLVTDRHPTDDLVGHSAAVVAMALRLAHAVGFSREDVLATGLAAALHDFGLLMVPDDVRRLSVKERSAGQQRRWEDHTLLGEAIFRPLTLEAPALALVALQHHEEQGGRGFPNGLTGGNRVLRSADSETPRIALVSEVIAVADRYERLVSGAPGEVPLSAAAARRVLATEAGARLNAEVVGRFLDLTPRWPAGVEVVLHGGAYEGARAVVIAPDPEGRDRPQVRLLAQPTGQVELTELNLAECPEVALSAVDEVVAA